MNNAQKSSTIETIARILGGIVLASGLAILVVELFTSDINLGLLLAVTGLIRLTAAAIMHSVDGLREQQGTDVLKRGVYVRTAFGISLGLGSLVESKALVIFFAANALLCFLFMILPWVFRNDKENCPIDEGNNSI